MKHHDDDIPRASRKGKALSVSMLFSATILGVVGIIQVWPFILYSGMALGGMALMLVIAREIQTTRCAQLDALLVRMSRERPGMDV